MKTGHLSPVVKILHEGWPGGESPFLSPRFLPLNQPLNTGNARARAVDFFHVLKGGPQAVGREGFGRNGKVRVFTVKGDDKRGVPLSGQGISEFVLPHEKGWKRGGKGGSR